MAETNSTCFNARTEKRQAILDAGHRIATLMAALDRDDGQQFRAFVSQMFAALEPLSPRERLCALDCADAEQGAAQ